MAYDWPGNVRELERVIERAVALAGSEFLEPDDLPPALLGGLCGSTPAVLAVEGNHAGVGESLRAAGARAVRQQQAPRLPGARNLLPHTECVSPVPAGRGWGSRSRRARSEASQNSIGSVGRAVEAVRLLDTRGDKWVRTYSTEQTVPCRRRERAGRSVRAAISSPQTGVKPSHLRSQGESRSLPELGSRLAGPVSAHSHVGNAQDTRLSSGSICVGALLGAH